MFAEKPLFPSVLIGKMFPADNNGLKTEEKVFLGEWNGLTDRIIVYFSKTLKLRIFFAILELYFKARALTNFTCQGAVF